MVYKKQSPKKLKINKIYEKYEKKTQSKLW